MLSWLSNVWSLSHEWIVALSVLSVGTFVICLLTLPRLFANLPEDYFSSDSRPKRSWTRNLLGLLLVAGGIAMLVLPGQGVLTILAGIVLLDFRGSPAGTWNGAGRGGLPGRRRSDSLSEKGSRRASRRNSARKVGRGRFRRKR